MRKCSIPRRVRAWTRGPRVPYSGVVSTFYDNFVRYRVARNYCYPFSSLTRILGITVVKLLPHFLMLGSEGLRCFQSPRDVHFFKLRDHVLAEVLKSDNWFGLNF
jgi:hypothetical protein